jgi:hypothetical protein
MEKNKQVLEFGELMKSAYPSCFVMTYKDLRSMYLDYLEFISMPWTEYINTRTKSEIIANIKNFNLYHYLPF